jgi:serine/threonine protein phosphatase PrpC
MTSKERESLKAVDKFTSKHSLPLSFYSRTATTTGTDANNPNKKDVIVGPLRVLPGRLSVSRTFGDAEAKLSKYGGNPNVVVATPEIKSFKITNEHDFVVLGCDGIFDKLNNKDTISCVWNSVTDN